MSHPPSPAGPPPSVSPSSVGPGQAPVLRIDARRNLERVKEEAERLFSERGSDVSIAEIAAAAGVGKATVYRSFPTKEDLLEAVALRRHGWFEERLTQALAEPVAWAAFERILLDLATRLERDRTLGEVLRAARGRPALQERKAASLATLQALLDRAIAEGAMRPGTSANDVSLMVSGCSMALTQDGGTAGDWRRLIGYVIDAFRA
ncbi:MAG: helix-turn-helix domain-containing protein [Solirubrobacteraceae bacterium]|nr:helix-turn-helix domain-containing protein [Solirubrobacteraceae bacterium]